MLLTELLPAAHALSRPDKLRLIQILAADLSCEEGEAGIVAGQQYPIWTPYHAYDVAAVLLAELGVQ